MTPPINIDGESGYGNVTIDGQTVKQITIDGQNVLSTIPNSAITQYLVSDFTTSNWPDSIGSLDLSTIANGLSETSTSFGGAGGVTSDGTDDFAQDGQFTFIQNNYYDTWAFAFGFSTTDDGGYISGVNDTSNKFDNLWQCDVGDDSTSGRLGTSRRFGSNNPTTVESSITVNDGGEYVAIIQSTGPTASDLEIYFEPSVNSATVNRSGTDGTGSESFSSTDITYYGRNSLGTVEKHLAVSLNDPRWFNTFLTQAERSDVFGLYNWYDPATDAP